MNRGLAALAAASACCVIGPSQARASALDVMGFGPTGVAEIGARAARADDGTAAFYSPGGLGLGHGVRLEVAPTLGVSALQAQGATHPLVDPFGVAIAFDATVPLTGVLADRLRIGFATYLQPNLARVLVQSEGTPVFPYFENRTQRLVVLPALAVKLFRGVAIGGGVNVLGGVAGPATVAQGESGAPEPRVTLEATTVARAVAGVRVDPNEKLHFAFAYRQKFSVPSMVDTSAVIGGLPLTVAVDAGQSLFDPDTFVLGASLDLKRVSLELDASYALWSAYHAPFVAVHATLPAVDIASTTPSGIARDVVSVRGAAAYRIDLGQHRLFLRGGAGFESSMLSGFQQSASNLVDSDKILVGLGASLDLTHVAGHTLRFGLGANATILPGYAQDKHACTATPCPADTVSGPDAAHPSKGITDLGFPRLSGGGAFFATSLGVGVEL